MSECRCSCGFTASGSQGEVRELLDDHTCRSASTPWHSNLFEGMWLFLIVAAFLAALVLCLAPGVFD